MRYLPIELDVRDRDALVLGADAEIVPKVERLLAAGARVTVVASGSVDPAIEERALAGALTLVRRPFRDDDASGKTVIYVSPNEESLGARLFERAATEGRLVCTLNRPETSTFANPAVASASGLVVSIGTGGSSPTVAARVREDLEAALSDPRVARFLSALGSLRATLPRGQRKKAMHVAAAGFGLKVEIVFPEWFERGAGPPTA